MNRAANRLGWWFFRRFLAASAVVFAAVAGLFVVIDLSERAGTLDRLARQAGALEAARLALAYYGMEILLEFLRFPDVVLTTAAGLTMYGLMKSGENVSIEGIGISLRRVAAPAAAAVFALGLGIALFRQWGVGPFTAKYEEVRSVVWNKGRSERAAFSVPGRGLVCLAESVLPDGSLEGLLVVDASDGLRVFRSGRAEYGESGLLKTGAFRMIYPPGGSPRGPALELKVAPLAALRFSRYGPFWVRTGDLLMLGDGAAAVEAGKAAGVPLLLSGLVMLALGLVMRMRERPTLSGALIAILLAEGIARVGAEMLSAAAPRSAAGGFAWGLLVQAAVFLAGLGVFLRSSG